MQGYGQAPPQPGLGGDPGKQQHFSPPQIHQLKAQIMAYRYLARSQQLVPGLVHAVHGRRMEGPAPSGGPPGQPMQRPHPGPGQVPQQPPRPNHTPLPVSPHPPPQVQGPPPSQSSPVPPQQVNGPSAAPTPTGPPPPVQLPVPPTVAPQPPGHLPIPPGPSHVGPPTHAAHPPPPHGPPGHPGQPPHMLQGPPPPHIVPPAVQGMPPTSGAVVPRPPDAVQPPVPSVPGQKQSRVTTIEKPNGIDPIVVLQERENRLSNRIVGRLQELSGIPSTMAEDLQCKAQVELRALRLFNFQRQLRQEILACMRRDSSLETSFQINAYKRTKRQGLREARATEKLEKQQRVEMEKKKRQEHQEFLAAVIQHGKDLKEYHKNNQAKIVRLNKAVLLYHVNAEREQKKKQELIEKERMRRLMAEDEEGYRKLIDQKKDKRLAFLLSQTDEYIANLTEMVKQHKQEQRRKQREAKKNKVSFIYFFLYFCCTVNKALFQIAVCSLQKKKKAVENPEGAGPVNGSTDENSQSATEVRVSVIERETGKVLKGEEAPTAAELQAWLDVHPGWEPREDDEDDESGDDESDEGEELPPGTSLPIPPIKPPVVELKEKDPEAIPVEQAKEVIQQAKSKVEDDEYKNQTGEQTYYGYVR